MRHGMFGNFLRVVDLASSTGWHISESGLLSSPLRTGFRAPKARGLDAQRACEQSGAHSRQKSRQTNAEPMIFLDVFVVKTHVDILFVINWFGVKPSTLVSYGLLIFSGAIWIGLFLHFLLSFLSHDLAERMSRRKR